MTRREFEKAYTKALSLKGGDVLEQYGIKRVRSISNGIGAAWMDSLRIAGKTLSDFLNKKFPWAVPASVIHDVRYTVGGNEEDRREADEEFLSNLKDSIEDAWYTGRYWEKRWKARAMYRLVRKFGRRAFTYTVDGGE